MNSCSKVLKDIGLGSTRNVAFLNGKNTHTINRAFNDDPDQFWAYVKKAKIDTCNQFVENIEAKLVAVKKCLLADCSKVLKNIGLGSTRNVAYLNGKDTSTITRAFNDNPDQFWAYVEQAKIYTCNRFIRSMDARLAEEQARYIRHR